MHKDLLDAPQPTLLPDDSAVRDLLESGKPAAEAAAAFPAAPAPWAALAEAVLAADDSLAGSVAAYAYARTGYHRGLDALRRNGWKGYGPVPWSHEPNRGFLRCVTVLARAAEAIGEVDEHERCTQLLRDCDPSLAP
jgi:hypothetical protein